MNPAQRAVLVLGLAAALGQLAVPPHTVRVSDMLNEHYATVTRWYPITGEPGDIVWLRGKEASGWRLGCSLSRAHGIATELLLIQLLATGLATAIVVLALSSRRGREVDDR